MNDVFLVKNGEKVRCFLNETEMKAAGFKKAGKTVTEEECAANGWYFRIIDNEIVVGKTPEEKAEEAKQEQIDELMGQLDTIDRAAGASRHVRDVSISAGVVIDSIRTLISFFAKKLEIELPEDFGKDLTSAEQILAMTPSSKLAQEETEMFYAFKSLLIISHYTQDINPGLTELKKAEVEAAQVRELLKPFL